ncbi:MAG: HopJ type III effector protein [Cyclobacteriaceae bacterium]
MCKSVSVAQKSYIQKISKEQTLACFGEHYQDVLNSPSGDSHQNIRNFMQYGWDEVSFQREALQPK